MQWFSTKKNRNNTKKKSWRVWKLPFFFHFFWYVYLGMGSPTTKNISNKKKEQKKKWQRSSCLIPGLLLTRLEYAIPVKNNQFLQTQLLLKVQKIIKKKRRALFIVNKVYSNKEKEKISWKKYINTDVYVECFKNLETMLCVKYSFSFSLYLILLKEM